jgi:hypothetical protein
MDFLVHLDVDDIEKAIRICSSAFGLKVGRRLGAFGVEMRGGSTPIYLLVNHLGRWPQLQPPSVEITSGIGCRSISILWLMKSNR